MEISTATSADRDATIALWVATGLTRPWNDPTKDFDLALVTESSCILLARKADDIVGSVMVGFDGHRGWVYYLATHPEHARSGVGTQLMRAAEAWLKEQSCPRIRLMVRSDNEAAQGFYKAIGYETQDVAILGRQLD